jgi:hypothetical protein
VFSRLRQRVQLGVQLSGQLGGSASSPSPSLLAPFTEDTDFIVATVQGRTVRLDDYA